MPFFKAENIDKSAGNTAVNRGANMLVSADEAETLDCLLRGVPVHA